MAELRPHPRAGAWMVAYLFVMAFVSRIGSTRFGGLGRLPGGWDLLIVAALGLAFYFCGLRSAWVNPSLRHVRDETEAVARLAEEAGVSTSV